MAETAEALEYEKSETTPLNQTISRRMLMFFVIGDVLGAGIYALVGEVGGKTGGAIWAAFLFALALAIFTAFSYAELVTKYPKAAGAALYVNKAFKLPFVTFLVAFAVMCSGLSSAATLSRAFGGDYLSAFVSWDAILVGLAFIVLIGLINLRGIRESMRFNFVLTMIEVSGLVLVMIIGIAFLTDGGGDPGRALDFKADTSVFSAILAGAGLAFFALIGFEDSVNLAEEAKKPKVDYPWALFGGLAVAGLIYLLVTVIASMAVPTDRLASSDGPLLEVTSQGPLEVNDKVFSVIALFALANGALINMIMASRLLYGMAREGILPDVFAKVHPRRQTPWVAILFTSLLAAGLLITGELEQLADTTVLLLLLVFAVVNVCVLILRRDRVKGEYFRAPTVMPVIGFVVSLALLTTKEADSFVRAAALLAIGALLYLLTWFTHGRHQPELHTAEMKTINDPR
ncbi:MAG TPA: APC family permease [Solirubrobacterales bacterium]|nr:APC family permease [Solirubrobacterales bacterium]